MKKAFIFILLFALHAFAQESEPKVVKAFAPENYPPVALAIGATGEVKVEVKIDNDGNVVSAKAIRGHILLHGFSEGIAKKWLFSTLKDFTHTRFATLTFKFGLINLPDQWVDGIESSKKIDFISKYPNPLEMNTNIYVTNFIAKTQLLPRIDGKIEEKYCELHKVKMKTEIVDIIYGLTIPNEGFEDIYKAEEKLFPNANFDIGGGCIVEPTEKIEVYYCDKCRIAHDSWVKKREIKLALRKATKK